jgi:hypothetical protein
MKAGSANPMATATGTQIGTRRRSHSVMTGWTTSSGMPESPAKSKGMLAIRRRTASHTKAARLPRTSTGLRSHCPNTSGQNWRFALARNDQRSGSRAFRTYHVVSGYAWIPGAVHRRSERPTTRTTPASARGTVRVKPARVKRRRRRQIRERKRRRTGRGLRPAMRPASSGRLGRNRGVSGLYLHGYDWRP